MNIYRVNEYDWYAAHSFEEAVRVAIDTTGLDESEVLDGFESDVPVPLDKEVWADDEQTEKISVGKILESMTEPGFAFGLEW